MNDKNVKIWQLVLALISLALVVVSMLYWLYGNVDGKTPLDTAEQESFASQISEYEDTITSLKRENERLKSIPPKEVIIEKECPATAPEMSVQPQECAPCPECPEPRQIKVTDQEGHKELTIRKPMAISTTVCTKMAIGKWGMPKSCFKEIRSFLDKQLNENTDFFVITPIVDTRQYRGLSPELKQAGLGQYRAQSVKAVLKEKMGPNIHIFQKKTMQKEEMRGFVLELYRIGQGE